MNLLTWTEDYNTGITEIDDQHMQLVALINRLHDALVARRRTGDVGAVLDELVDYTKVHFAVEECLQRIFEYQGYDEHKAIHDAIIAQLTGFQRRFRAGDAHVGMELLLFLKEWLFEHISKVDQDYVPTFPRKRKRLWG